MAVALVVLGCGATSAAVAGTASVGTGAASAAPGASIALNGSGVRGGGAAAFAFSVHASTPADSAGVYGTFSGTFPQTPSLESANPLATFSGVVTCLQSSGNTVTYGGIITLGYGYDLVSNQPSPISQNERDLAGDFFVTTVADPAGSQPDTIGSVVWGDRAYYTTPNFFTAPDGSFVNYSSFSSVCNNPEATQGTANQSPLLSGDIHIGPPTS
jgi:hypothetical protein